MKKRVLVFDDDDGILRLMTNSLSSAGFDVVAFNCVEEWFFGEHISCKASGGPRCGDAIVADVKMPGIDGIQLVGRLRKKRCPVCGMALMSGSWTSDTLSQADGLGCQIFRKPVSVSRIISWVKKITADVHAERVLVDRFDQTSSASL